MIADLKPYAEYKESGLPWLGRVPGHWDVQRLKNWVTINRRSLGEETPPDFAFDYLDIGSITTGRMAKRPSRLRFADAPSRARRILQPGDTIVSTVRTYLKAVMTVSEHSQPLVASTGFAVLSPRPDATPRCLGYVAQSEAFTHQVTAESVGIAYPAISETRLGNIAVTLPPPSEQAAIVRFLDWSTGKLERAIRAKRKVIALLGEQKQAIIHRAVTRGLDPSVPLKPSGIPWLGDIPQHWEVMPLKGVCAIQSGITLGKDYTGQALHEYPYLRVANVQAGYVNLSVVKTIRVTKAEADRCTLQSGDVLMTEGGDLDKLGRGCVWNAQVSPCLHQNHVFAVRPSQSRLEPRFLSALMGTGYARAYFQSSAKQTTNLAVTNKTKLGMFKVLLPGVDEQQRILVTLDEELRPVNIATARLKREIELLREYRTRLVADVVTGKLDVREAAARLPDEAPLDTIEDDADLGDETEAADEEAVA